MKDVVWEVTVKDVKSSPHSPVTAHKMVGILLEQADCGEYVALNLDRIVEGVWR